MSYGTDLKTKMQSWIQNNQNVLFIGKHGIGKTSLVKQAFNEAKLNWLYFSAATMDPWCDFIGVPKEASENINGQSINYLKLVRPRAFATGEVQALFFDEFNRSHKKIRNAVMELIQFKSINGEKFPNLKIVWAAINPYEVELYDVEKLDLPQLDRFQVHYRLPYKPDYEYFKEKYGVKSAKAAIEWWNELEDEEKENVSPRRLDYALETYNFKGDLRDVLPVTSNVSKLITALYSGPITETIEQLMKTKDKNEAKSFLSNENNFHSAIKYILQSPTMMKFFLPVLSKEKISSLVCEHDVVINFILKNINEENIFLDVCNDILKANQNHNIIKKIRKTLTENQDLNDILVEYRRENSKSSSKNVELFYVHEKNSSFHEDIKNFKDSMEQSYIDDELWNKYVKFVEKIPKAMSSQDAQDCLVVLNTFCVNLWMTYFHKKQAELIPGIINTCFKNISESSASTYANLKRTNFIIIKDLLEKCKIAGLDKKIKLDW